MPSVMKPGVTNNTPAITSNKPSAISCSGMLPACIFCCACIRVLSPCCLTKCAPAKAVKITIATVYQPPICSPTLISMAISTMGKMANNKNSLNKDASLFELYVTSFTYTLYVNVLIYDIGTDQQNSSLCTIILLQSVAWFV